MGCRMENLHWWIYIICR